MQGIDGGQPQPGDASDQPETRASETASTETASTETAAAQPSAPAEAPDASAAPARCSWCSTTAPAGSARCPSCGAALVESGVIGSYGIPGVTGVDPGVVAGEELARRQLKRQARGPHMLGSTLGFVGVPFGHVIGNAIEDIVAARSRGPSSEANAMGIMDLLELERKPEQEQAADAPAQPSAQLADPWVDLPPPAIEDQIAGTEFDPWATRDQSAGGAYDPWAAQPPGGSPFDPWAGQPAPDPAAGDPAPPQPNVLAPRDPWSFEGGPWSQDPWANRDEGPGSDPSKRR